MAAWHRHRLIAVVDRRDGVLLEPLRPKRPRPMPMLRTGQHNRIGDVVQFLRVAAFGDTLSVRCDSGDDLGSGQVRYGVAAIDRDKLTEERPIEWA